MIDLLFVLFVVGIMIVNSCLVVFVECIKNKISEYIDIELIIDLILI